MTHEGTVVNGAVVLDDGVRLPEGARVRLKVIEDHPPDHPCAPYDRETELAILRASIEDLKAGRGIPLEEAMAQIAKEFNLPPVPPE